MASDTEITKVRIVIRHLLWQIREVRTDRDAAWKWVNRFANTLQYQDLEQDPDQYALAILAEARSFNDQKKRNGQMKWVREQLAKEGVTRPTQEQLDEKWLEMYGNETTADGDIREDSHDRKSGTSADIYGDADTSDGAEESTTVSRNMGEDAATRKDAEDRKSATSSPAHLALDNSQDKDKQGPRRANHPAETAPSHGGSVATVSRRAVPLPDFDTFTAYIDREGLDYSDAREWWEMTMVDRDGKDRDGKRITNWKGALRRFCTARSEKRRTA